MQAPSPGQSRTASWTTVLQQHSPAGNRWSYWKGTHACCQLHSFWWAAHFCCRTDEHHASGGEPAPRNVKVGLVSFRECGAHLGQCWATRREMPVPFQFLCSKWFINCVNVKIRKLLNIFLHHPKHE